MAYQELAVLILRKIFLESTKTTTIMAEDYSNVGMAELMSQFSSEMRYSNMAAIKNNLVPMFSGDGDKAGREFPVEIWIERLESGMSPVTVLVIREFKKRIHNIPPAIRKPQPC
ncbi:MAG: hypothetical protein U9Q67_03660 [Patescibacteria group bacterium]|nr:hypothetical protein [Patescibacteria group bacterium]